MKKLLSLIVILALVAWGGYKGAVWWLADQTLTDIRRALSDHGALVQGQIGSTIDGELTLTDTRFQPFRLTEALALQQMHFRTPSPQALIAALSGEHDLPASWRLDVTDWSLPLGTAMLRDWVTSGGERERPLLLPVCEVDGGRPLGSDDLINMGIEGLGGDAQLHQTGSGVRLEVFSRDAGSVDVFWSGARLRFDQGQTEFNPGAEEIRVILRDGGLMRRIAAYCARETGMPVPAWAELVLTSFRDGLEARGVGASPQLLALYRRWLTEGGELELALDPDAPMMGIPVGEPAAEEGLEQAGEPVPALDVIYNGAKVPDVYLIRADGPASEPSQENRQSAAAPSQAPAVVAGWQSIPVDEAEQWLGYTVRVTLSNGRGVEGRLIGVDDRQVEVARPVDGGEVAYPMATRAVARFEVWRRGQRNP
ncbi:hypothetical protein SAMN05216203_3224 [Marinobacter daqiaonensis]|uniref:Acetylornithine deacetylase n=1 Tax=Marinobacter daqiaonensis TaxID=650891 RepID=A0A1I6JS69_9GAMM|nr:LSm family protein [Marinobacter daqiaonensis]SFR81826.1 hypothetical protein SAMN05216203_3224 [Marinobacter daqiaonensis]